MRTQRRRYLIEARSVSGIRSDRLTTRSCSGFWVRQIHDNRFLRLLRNMLTAGYLEDWMWNATLSGAPQGGVVSPILSNIYLHKLDKFVETVLIPEYTRGVRRKGNPAYYRVKDAARTASARGDHAAVRQLRKQMRTMPSGDPHDPGYRRLRYCRYADDTCSGSPDPRPKPRRSSPGSRVPA